MLLNWSDNSHLPVLKEKAWGPADMRVYPLEKKTIAVKYDDTWQQLQATAEPWRIYLPAVYCLKKQKIKIICLIYISVWFIFVKRTWAVTDCVSASWLTQTLEWVSLSTQETDDSTEDKRSSRTLGGGPSDGAVLTWLLWMEMAQASLSGSCCRLRWIPPPDLNTQRSGFSTCVTPHRKRTCGSPGDAGNECVYILYIYIKFTHPC